MHLIFITYFYQTRSAADSPSFGNHVVKICYCLLLVDWSDCHRSDQPSQDKGFFFLFNTRLLSGLLKDLLSDKFLSVYYFQRILSTPGSYDDRKKRKSSIMDICVVRWKLLLSHSLNLSFVVLMHVTLL